MIIKDAVIMHIMKTANGLDITREMVESSIDTFEKITNYTQSRFHY